MRTLSVLLLTASFLGCNAADAGPGDATPVDPPATPTTAAAPGDDGGTPVPVPEPCPPRTHKEGLDCVADEIACAAEFPCAIGECVGGRCVDQPGPCATNDDCPVGNSCVDGMCAPVCPMPNPACRKDADCGPDAFCVACACVSAAQCARPTPDLSGAAWSADQVLHLDEALGAFGQIFAGLVKDLRDGVLGCPKGSGADCVLYQVVANYIPDYGKKLILIVGDFADVFDNHQFLVASQMSFARNGKRAGYSGVDHWTRVTFNYHNHVVSAAPENVAQIGKPVVIALSASAVCGVVYVDKHSVDGTLSGILRWVLDSVVEIETCGNGGPCYHTLGQAIDGALDCTKVANFAARIACEGATKGLRTTIDAAIDSWLLDYSLMTLAGTARAAQSGRALVSGHWDGTLGNGKTVMKNFTGEWTATR